MQVANAYRGVPIYVPDRTRSAVGGGVPITTLPTEVTLSFSRISRVTPYRVAVTDFCLYAPDACQESTFRIWRNAGRKMKVNAAYQHSITR
ncbi:hypothetical protein [Caballeronia sp. RCC_10]|uniref:hypothetical protein n=1 Tax=Caballeronia sp. RCC_10 TaxID=3239227 RepID=UPI0035239675